MKRSKAKKDNEFELGSIAGPMAIILAQYFTGESAIETGERLIDCFRLEYTVPVEQFAKNGRPIDGSVLKGMLEWEKSIDAIGLVFTFSYNGHFIEVIVLYEKKRYKDEDTPVMLAGKVYYREDVGSIDQNRFLESSIDPEATFYPGGRIDHKCLPVFKRTDQEIGSFFELPDGTLDAYILNNERWNELRVNGPVGALTGMETNLN